MTRGVMVSLLTASWLTLNASTVTAQWSIDTAKLLAEMPRLQGLMRWPNPPYVTRQFSSYDRRSTSPDDSANWFANTDWGQFVREEKVGARTEYVMMEAEGPGAIVRIWTANPVGTYRFYFDRADEPQFAVDAKKLFAGEVPGIPVPLAGERSRGWNVYFPIPYRHHAKVTCDKSRFYYHVNYRTYPPGTEVDTFSAEDLTRYRPLIEKIAKQLAHPATLNLAPSDAHTTRFAQTLAVGTDVTAVALRGSQRIVALRMTLLAEDAPAAARETVMELTFDDETTVACPVGDFFGSAPGLIPYASLPMGITDETPPVMWCHWPMPFQRKAHLRFRNLGDQEVTLKGSLAMRYHEWRDRSLYFHAGWRIERDIPATPPSDWTHLRCTGRGRLVGSTLHIVNNVASWWGEGDEKIYVDGETFPSFFGTGTEDYYGYAWCSPEPFNHAYHNQLYAQGPGNFGHIMLSRFHILDDIPFTQSLRFDIENLHPHPSASTTRAAVCYWYAKPGGTDFYAPITEKDVAWERPGTYEPLRVPGAIEAETMTICSKTGRVEPQFVGDRHSNGHQLWWTKGKPGDKVELAFDVAEPGRQHVLVRATRTPEYGIIQLHINGQPAGEPLDLYSEAVHGTEEIDLGEFDLKAGTNTLTLELLGANEKATKDYAVGIDYIKLK